MLGPGNCDAAWFELSVEINPFDKLTGDRVFITETLKEIGRTDGGIPF